MRVSTLVLVACLAPATLGLMAPRPSLGRGRVLKLKAETPSSAFAADEEQWSFTRRVTSGLAFVGVCETSYLTWQKFIGASIVQCGPTECGSVLTGPYSSIFGIPVSAMGLASYLFLFAFSAAPIVFSARSNLERGTRLPLLIVSTFMASFSLYLISLLIFKLHTVCTFCFVSAALSWSSFFFVQRAATSDPDGIFKPIIVPTAASVAAAFLAAAVSLYVAELNIALDEARTIAIAIAEQGGPVAAVQSSPNGRFFPPGSSQAAAAATASSKPLVTFSAPAVDTVSTERTLRLAKHLQAKGARVYGAYWCSHCYNQKQIFGAEAAKFLNYIECAPDGDNSQRGLCQDRHISGYPTWEINGKFYAGEKSVAELEDLSGLPPPPGLATAGTPPPLVQR